MIDDCLVLTRHLSSKADVTLKRDDRSTATILVERTELQQVIINLVVNAIHAMPEGGTLTLETEDREAEGMAGVAIIVTDTGRGMAPEVLKRIFDPFFTTKRAQGRDSVCRSARRSWPVPGAGSRRPARRVPAAGSPSGYRLSSERVRMSRSAAMA